MTLLSNLTTAGLPVSQAQEDGNSITWSTPPTDEQMQLCRDIVLQYVDPTARADIVAGRTDRAQIKAELQATITQLKAIENAVSPTNAQVIAAMKFIAKTLRLILKLLARTL